MVLRSPAVSSVLGASGAASLPCGWKSLGAAHSEGGFRGCEDFKAHTLHRPECGDGHGKKRDQGLLAPFPQGFVNPQVLAETGSLQKSLWKLVIHAAATRQRNRGGEPALHTAALPLSCLHKPLLPAAHPPAASGRGRRSGQGASRLHRRGEANLQLPCRHSQQKERLRLAPAACVPTSNMFYN